MVWRDLPSPNVYQVGLGAFLLSLSAFFVGLILAFSFRIDAEGSWKAFHVPALMWLSTAILATSSWSIESARHALRRARVALYRRRLGGAIAMGLLFLAAQLAAALNLIRQGVTTTANPHGSAFYIFMGIHGAHLLGGLVWLVYLYRVSRWLIPEAETELRNHRTLAWMGATYWHFMGAVWGALFFFLLHWTRTD